MSKYNAIIIGAAQRYTAHVKKMLRTSDRATLFDMEDKRVQLHNEFLDALKKYRIPVNRSESEDLAWSIATNE